MDLFDLADICETQEKVIKKAANEAAISLAIDLITALIKATPVDTSRALSSWLAGINVVNDEDIRHGIYQGKRGSTAEASRNAAIAKATAIIKGKKAGDSIIISNNAPYILRLNNGWSPQASPLFIERQITLVNAKLKAGDYNK